MKVVALTKYGDLAASTRQRFIQYRHYLEEQGLELEIFPLLDNCYLRSMFENKSASRLSIMNAYLKRMQFFFSKRQCDVIWLHCESFPYLPGFFEKLSGISNTPIVYDYDDAIFHTYDRHSRHIIRKLLGGKTESLASNSSLVMAGNQYLADWAEAVGAKHVEIVPTVVDTNAYGTQRHPAADGRLRIGWIGSPSTWVDYCAPMIPMLTDVATTHGAIIRAVGAGQTAIPGPTLECLPWSEATEVALIQSMDIGLMPLDDSPWARGKCGYKLIQYMACGLPVVASPVGVNREIVEHGVNGFLVETKEDWSKALGALLGDSELRQRMGAAGRKKVEQKYSLQTYGPKVAAMLLDVVNLGKSLAR